MKNSKFKTFKLITFFLFIYIFLNTQSFSHEDLKIGHNKHAPISCKLESERTWLDKMLCKNKRDKHSLCKFDIHCALLKMDEQDKLLKELKELIEKQKRNIEELDKALGDMTLCTDITFKHKTSEKTKLFRAPTLKAKVIKEIEKNEEILFVSPSSKNKKWYFVLGRKDNTCNSGYIQQKFVIKKESDDGDIIINGDTAVNGDKKSQLISIISPDWRKEGKLIVVNAPGVQTIRGLVDESKIDEIIVDGKVRAIQSDSTFSFSVFLKKDTKEIRITGNKNGKKVKSLIFKIRVGS